MRRWILIFLALAMLALGACSKKPSKEMLDAVKPPTVEQADPADTPQDTEQTEPEDEPTADDTAETSAPDTDFLSGEWVEEAPAGAMRVSVDADGEELVLRTTRALSKVWISRVEYDETAKDYVRTERVWWMEQWDADTPLLLVMRAPVEQAELELSWADEFGERERRLIVPVRIFRQGKAEESVQLLHYAVPLSAAELTAGAAYHYDLSGNGQKETITFSQQTVALAVTPVAKLRVTQANAVYEANMTLLDACCWIADLDGDNVAELYVSGDTVSGGTLTYGWRLGGAGLESIPIADEIRTQDADGSVCIAGRVEQIDEDGIVYMTDTAALPGGTYTARAMFYGVGGEFAALDGYWTLEGGEELTLRTALPVTLRDGTQQTLPAGTKLRLTGSDRETMADFETESGIQGTLELEKQRGYDGWYIGGKQDTELFS